MYILNKNTLFIYFDGKNTIINELSTEFSFSNNILKKILENSCIYYGSSLKGRMEGSKNLINSKYRLPIIISDKNNLIFFPINGAKKNEIIWFNFNMIKIYIKEKNFVKIIFNNNYEQQFMISYTIFNNQMLKCSRLWWVYNSRN